MGVLLGVGVGGGVLVGFGVVVCGLVWYYVCGSVLECVCECVSMSM